MHTNSGFRWRVKDMCLERGGGGKGASRGGDLAGKNLRVGPLVDGNIHAFPICS